MRNPVEGLPTGAQPILYPPTALVLFVPFTVLPAALWWLVPLGVTTWRIVALRPSWLAWACIGLLAAWPQTIYNVITGNPGLWVMAFVALGTRWPAFGPWVLLKPTLFPFALTGALRWPRTGRERRFLGKRVKPSATARDPLNGRRSPWSAASPDRSRGASLTGEGAETAGPSINRQWLAGLAAFALVSAVFLPMWPDYLTVVRNAQAGLLYSVPQASLPLIPLVAWLGRRAVDDVAL